MRKGDGGMLEQLYEWIRGIAYFMVFAAMLDHVVPGEDYRKYIRFFTGLLLVVLLVTPLLKLAGMGGEILSLYRGSAYTEELEQIREAGAYFQDIGSAEDPGGVRQEEERRDGEGNIHVEDIRIEE